MPWWDFKKNLSASFQPQTFTFLRELLGVVSRVPGNPSGGRHPRILASRTFGAAAYRRVARNSSFRSLLSAYEYHPEWEFCIYLGPEREAVQSGHTVRDVAALLSSSTVHIDLSHLDWGQMSDTWFQSSRHMQSANIFFPGPRSALSQQSALLCNGSDLALSS